MLQSYKPIQIKTKTIQPYKIPKNNKIQIPPPHPSAPGTKIPVEQKYFSQLDLNSHCSNHHNKTKYNIVIITLKSLIQQIKPGTKPITNIKQYRHL